MTERARVFPALDGGYWLETPYNPSYVADLKTTLPTFARRWEPDLKLWWVAPEFITLAEQVLARHYEVASPPTATNNGNADAYKTLWLRPGAPQELVRSAYRTLAKLHHPDAGGDTRQMQRINAAFEQLGGA